MSAPSIASGGLKDATQVLMPGPWSHSHSQW